MCGYPPADPPTDPNTNPPPDPPTHPPTHPRTHRRVYLRVDLEQGLVAHVQGPHELQQWYLQREVEGRNDGHLESKARGKRHAYASCSLLGAI